jgi:biopolymer transport protein ExbB
MMRNLALALFVLPSALWPDASSLQIIEIKKIFASSPFIYGILIVMSIGSMAIWLYTLATFRSKDIMPGEYLSNLRSLLEAQEWMAAKDACLKHPSLLSSIVNAGLITRELGPSVMIDAMKAEGKRASTPFWQRLSLLNDIAIVAPMLGLLGTVIGMFYAFYDVNRSVESINALFDGLGIAVGTTVAGLIVAILSMIFSTTLKYRLVKTLSHVENEAVGLSALIPRP